MKEMRNLKEIYNKEEVSEIIIDRFDDVYWEEGGKIIESDSLFKDEEEVFSLVDSILRSVGKNRESIENGFTDLRLGDGTRVAITLPPISINGPALVIRKLPTHDVLIDDLKKWKAVDDNGWKICEKLINKNTNIILAGNAGSGKTTVLNLLTDVIPKEYRVVTVEKIAEMRTDNRKRTLRLETPNAKQFELKELLHKAGLLRADYLIVNELQGSEAFEAISFMRGGYSVLATLMAEGVRDALKKLEIFCMMDNLNISSSEIKYHIGTGIGAVIFQERLPNGKRVISNISLIEGVNEKNEFNYKSLYYYDEDSESFLITEAGKAFLCS